MKTKTFLTIGTAALVFAGVLTLAQAQPANDSTTSATSLRGQIMKRVADKLNLTADQKSQIKTIFAGERDTLKSLISQLHDARKNLRAAIQSGDANESSVRAASAKAAAVEADLAVERMKIYGKIAPVLTDEQRRKISDFTQRADNFTDSAIAQIGDGTTL